MSYEHLTDRQRGQFARCCALQVAHLWTPPVGMLAFLVTGDEDLRKELIASQPSWEGDDLPVIGYDAWRAAMRAAEAALNNAVQRAADMSVQAVQHLAVDALLRAAKEQKKIGALGVHASLIVGVDHIAIERVMKRQQEEVLQKIMNG